MTVLVWLLLLFCFELSAADRFVKSVSCPACQVIIVAEGELEPRSIGSYSIRLYGAPSNGMPADDFLHGLIRPRNGTIRAILFADLDGDDQKEAIVTHRNVGTGSFLSADAFKITGEKLKPFRSFSNLPRDTDPIKELKH